MILIVLFIGAVLIISAARNSQAALGKALVEDIPPFIVWGAAIIAVGALGYIPGLKAASRGLLALVLTVLILTNYKVIIGGFQTAWKNPPQPQQDNSSGGGSILSRDNGLLGGVTGWGGETSPGSQAGIASADNGLSSGTNWSGVSSADTGLLGNVTSW